VKVLPAVPGLVAVLVLAGCTVGDQTQPEPSTPTVPVIQPGTPGGENSTVSTGPTTPAVDPDDVTFLGDMMVHHSQALRMAGWAQTKAANRSVKAIAERIRVGQQPEINAMRTMLTQWGKPAPDLTHTEHSDHSGMPGMARPEQLAALERTSGTAFDRMFLQLMIRHHQGAVTMSLAQARTGQDLRTLELAQEIGVTQTKEIATMLNLRRSL
jgi:uncharacterized protein (DUF305 family)